MRYTPEWYQKNKESLVAAKKRHYQKNKERLLQKQKQYDDTHKDQRKSKYKTKKVKIETQ